MRQIQYSYILSYKTGIWENTILSLKLSVRKQTYTRKKHHYNMYCKWTVAKRWKVVIWCVVVAPVESMTQWGQTFYGSAYDFFNIYNFTRYFCRFMQCWNKFGYKSGVGERNRSRKRDYIFVYPPGFLHPPSPLKM